MTDPVAEDSFPKRLIYKLSANVLGVFLSFFQAGMVSRALGPRMYGDYNFLINFFFQLLGFVEMRSSTFLYTSLSRHKTKTSIVAVYSYLAAGISVLILLVPVAAIMFGVETAIWPDQNGFVVILVAAAALVIWYADLFAKVCDALGLTVSLERTRAITRIILFVGIAAALQWNALNIQSYITLQVAAYVLLMIVLGRILSRTSAFAGTSFHPLKIDMRSTLGDVVSFSHPLFVYTLAAFVIEYSDRWVLQRFNGSTEQGLFSLAVNIGLAFNVLVNALHPLVMREFSVAFEQKDSERARRVFDKLIRVSYTISAFFLCYAAVNADGLVRIVGGQSFEGAADVFAIMAFLPILNNYSLLSASALYASHRTRLLRNIGVFMTPLSIAATFFLVGPREYGALNLGAVGLALKLVMLEFLGNNIILYFNCKMLNLHFGRHVVHQIWVAGTFTATAWICRYVASFAAGATAANWLVVMLLGGFIYVGVSLVMFYLAPSMTGIRAADREDALRLLKQAMARPQSAATGNPPIP